MSIKRLIVSAIAIIASCEASGVGPLVSLIKPTTVRYAPFYNFPKPLHAIPRHFLPAPVPAPILPVPAPVFPDAEHVLRSPSHVVPVQTPFFHSRSLSPAVTLPVPTPLAPAPVFPLPLPYFTPALPKLAPVLPSFPKLAPFVPSLTTQAFVTRPSSTFTPIVQPVTHAHYPFAVKPGLPVFYAKLPGFRSFEHHDRQQHSANYASANIGW